MTAPAVFPPSDAGSRRLTGRHVLIALIAFFAVTFAVNAAFIYFAVTTFSGIETENAYRRGLAYNQQHELARTEAAFGWRGEMQVEAGQPVVVLTGPDNKPLTGAIVAAKAGRPSVDRFDRRLVMLEVGGGRYRAEGPPLAAGAWMVVLEARDRSAAGSVVSLRMKERLWVSR